MCKHLFKVTLVAIALTFMASGAVIQTTVTCTLNPTGLQGGGSVTNGGSCSLVEPIPNLGTAKAIAVAEVEPLKVEAFVVALFGGTFGYNYRAYASATAIYETFIETSGPLRDGYAQVHPLVETGIIDGDGKALVALDTYEWYCVGLISCSPQLPIQPTYVPVKLGGPVPLKLHAYVTGAGAVGMGSAGEYASAQVSLDMYEADMQTPVSWWESDVPEPSMALPIVLLLAIGVVRLSKR